MLLARVSCVYKKNASKESDSELTRCFGEIRKRVTLLCLAPKIFSQNSVFFENDFCKYFLSLKNNFFFFSEKHFFPAEKFSLCLMKQFSGKEMNSFPKERTHTFINFSHALSIFRAVFGSTYKNMICRVRFSYEKTRFLTS